MNKELQFVNNLTKEYVITQDGNNEPDRQNLSIGSTVEDAIISHAIVVAENDTNSNYKKFASANHNYYSSGTNAYIVESGNASENLPQYLMGWQYYNNGVLTDFNGAGSTVDTSFVQSFFSSDTNLDLYAKWGDTIFLRVVVTDLEIKPGSLIPAGDFVVTIAEPNSYNNTTFALPQNFKSVKDNSNGISDHLLILINGDDETREFGTGDGCPSGEGQYRRPSYFAIKGGNNPTISISISNSNYIPEYSVVGGAVSYTAYLCDYGLSRDLDQTNAIPVNLSTSNHASWTYSMTNVLTDKTLFVPVVIKPSVTAMVQSSSNGHGHVRCTLDSSTPSSINLNSETVYLFPGGTCHIWAQAETGYTFNGWYSTNAATDNPISTGAHYTVQNVSNGAVFYARFVASAYTITYHKEYSPS